MSDKIVHVTDGSFEDDVLKAEDPVLVDYWAEWCGPCKAIAPILGEIAEEYAGRVKIAKLNIDENPSIPPKYGIRGIPTLMLFKEGNVEATKVGALSKSQLSGVSRQQHLTPGRARAHRSGAPAPPGGDPLPTEVRPGVSGGRYRNTVVALSFNGGVQGRRALPKASQSRVDLPASRASAFVRTIFISPRCSSAT